MTKFELSISTSYVPSWGIVEAIRELFQNAIDQQTENKDNEMYWNYNDKDEVLRIGNKTSVLTKESLLLGESSKRGNDKTIGQHGEGYKLAFMILLREHKKIKVYNYGAKEIWEARLVKSRKYGTEIPTIFVTKQPIWDKTPSHDLIIEITGISQDEYGEIVKSNLHLKYKNKDKEGFEALGSTILTDPSESGNMYVAGLFVMHSGEYNFGYDFKPSDVKLDRDRKMLSDFDIKYQASKLWKEAAENNEEALKIVQAFLMYKKSSNFKTFKDMEYISSINSLYTFSPKFYSKVEETYIEEYGDDCIPVDNIDEYEVYKERGNNVALLSEQQYKLVKNTKLYAEKLSELKEESDIEATLNMTLKEKFEAFASKIKDDISYEDYEYFKELIKEL